eukprot:11256-Heterococcus_DN1.PRE.2
MREERLAAAKAALCVAFEVLELMRRYRLDVEELVYRALIDACVRTAMTLRCAVAALIALLSTFAHA